MPMSFTAALIILAAQAEPKITLELPISPLTVIAKEMASQTGLPHLVRGPETDQWVFVQVKDMPASRLREALAKATGGRWVSSGDGWILQTKDLSGLEDQAFVASITEWRARQKPVPAFDLPAFEAAVKRTEEISQAEYRGANYTELDTLMSTGPDRRLLQRILLMLPLAELTGIKAGESQFFSLEPTSLQRPLPRPAGSALADFASEAEQASRRLEAIAPPEGSQQRMTTLTLPFQAGERLTSATRILLNLRRLEGAPGTLVVEATLYDKQGMRVHSISHSIGSSPSRVGGIAELAVKALGDLKGAFEPSPEERAFAKDFMAAVGQIQPGAKKEPVSESTKQRLLNMDKVDLLTFGATEVMQSFAKETGKQVLAKVNDMAIYASAVVTMSAREMKGPPLGYAVAITTGIYGANNAEISEESDLIVFPPSASPDMPRFRLPRRETARLVRASLQGRDLLDPLADLSLVCRSSTEMMFPTMLTSLAGGSAPMLAGEDPFNVLKLYGYLSHSERQTVKDGGLTLRIDRLHPAMQRHLLKTLLTGRDGMTYPLPEGNGADLPPRMSTGVYHLAPSVFLASPKAAQGSLTISLTKTDGLLRSYGSALQGARICTVEQVAWDLYSREQYRGSPPQELLYAQGTLMSLNASVLFPKAAVATKSFEIPSLAPGTQLMGLKELPSDFREAVEKRLNEIRLQYRNSGGSGAVKPPQQR